MGEQDARRRPGVWAALVAVYVIWGSAYLGIEVAGRTFPPLLMLSLRFLLAGGLLYTWAIRRGESGIDRPGRPQWRAAAIVGAGLLLVGNGGVALAVRDVDTGVVALIVASVPLWLALLDRVCNGVRLAPVAIVGLVVGFGGVALLVADGGAGRDELGGALLVVFGSLTWAAGSIYTRGAPLPERPLVGAAMQMLTGGALLGVADVWLLGEASVSLIGTYAYVNPMVAVLLGVTLLGEPLGWRLFVAGGAIVVAVGLIVSASPRPPSGRSLPSPGDPVPSTPPSASVR